ncbi:MAG: alpha-hydroxy acid oxidase [Candidatus Tectimicrobiota bacterium]
MRLEPINLFDYEARAKQVLPHAYWDFIAGGSKDEITTQRNRTALDAICLRPRFLRDVTQRKLSTTVLGTPISFPVMVAPAGGHKIAHPEGECATARGAGMSKTLMMLSTSSHCSMEDVAKEASGPLWFQLYHRGYELSQMLVRRAEEAGYKAVALTVDTPLPAPKERDIRNRYENPFPLGNFRATTEEMPSMSGTDEAPNWQPARVPALTWKELEWLRSLTTLPLVLKGVRTAEDAHVAVESGVNGLLVSTHGGRQMDATLSAVESLPEIAEVCKGRAEVYLDSGVRRGSDVLKALALGARAVAVGRPLYWGLAVNGAEGVHGMLELLRSELDQVMGYCGQTDVENLDAGLVTVPFGWGNGKMYP